MSLIWCDGFDHYGTDLNQAKAGFYAEMTGAFDSTHQRNGAYCWAFQSFEALRRTFGSAKSVVGIGFAINFSTLPVISNVVHLAAILDQDANRMVVITTTTDGRIRIYNGNLSTLLGTSGQVLTPNNYLHFECRVVASTTVGSVEVRLDGVTVLSVTGVNTIPGGTATLEQVQIGSFNSSNKVYVDDLFAWDGNGTEVNDFMGDHRARLAPLTADTAQADWTRNTGSTDYGTLTEIPADDDTTFIFADAAYQQSDFAFDDVPSDVAGIASLFVVGKMRKTQAGVCNAQMKINSGVSIGSGTDQPLSTVWTYYGDAFDVDPNTGVPWTIAAVNAATVGIERTA